MISLVSGINKNVSTFCDLFSSENLLNDETQIALLPYIWETQELLTKAIRQMDPNGSARIIPSLDLGISYNTGRLAGGFSTGMVVDWKSGVPFFPIDSTIKSCAGSIMQVECSGSPDDYFNFEGINEAINRTREDGFQFDFTSGNHFLSLYTDSLHNYYIVIHCGDDSFRNLTNGAYPYQGVWYEKDVQIIQNENTNRYLKYLSGDSAQKVIDFCINKQNDISLLQRKIGEYIMKNDNRILSSQTSIHYGFCSSHTLLLGVTSVSENQKVPIFSNNGRPIIEIQPSKKMWSVLLDGKRVFLYPHGWGCQIKNLEDIQVTSDGELSIILKTGEIISQSADYKRKLPKDIVTVRNLHGYDDVCRGILSFESMWNYNMYGEITRVLFPYATYDSMRRKVIKFGKEY